MYLVSQIWWSLFLAFLLGVMVGYVLWRACGRRRMEASNERARQELLRRIATL